jgi:hypothetical protein
MRERQLGGQHPDAQTSTPGSPSRWEVCGLAGVCTRPAGCPTRGVPPSSTYPHPCDRVRRSTLGVAAPYLAALHRTVASLQAQMSETHYQLHEAARLARLSRQLYCDREAHLPGQKVDWIYNGDMGMWSEPVEETEGAEGGDGFLWVERSPALAANWSVHFAGYTYSLHGGCDASLARER